MRAARLESRAILEAIERGDFYASTGVELADYQVNGTTMTVLLPINGPETKKAETAEVTQITPREPVVARKSEWPDEVRRAL